MRFIFTNFVLLLVTAMQVGISHAALSPANVESAKLHKTTHMQVGKAHTLNMSYHLEASALADKKILLIQSVFHRTHASDYVNKTASYHNLSTLSIIKWPILNGENPSYKHGLSENVTGIKLDVPFLEQMLDTAALELTAKKHFSGKEFESSKSEFSMVNFIRDAVLFLGVIYILLFPIVGSVFGGMKFVQNRRNSA